MAQIILTFGLEKEKLRAVRSAALKNKMQVKEISRINYGRSLAFLPEFRDFVKKKQTITARISHSK